MRPFAGFSPLDWSSPFPGPILFAPETTSTMDAAAELVAASGAEDGTLLMTDHQTRGRGRRADRVWTDAPGASLLCTLLLKSLRLKSVSAGPDRPRGGTAAPPESAAAGSPAAALSLRVGVVVAETVEALTTLSPEIKWPNDLLLDGKKVCGILITQGRGWVQIGLGLNIRGGALAPGVAGSATSLADELPAGAVVPSRRDLLTELLRGLFAELDGTTGPWRERLCRRLAYRERRVTFSSPAFDAPLSGILEGVAPDGALLFRELRRVPGSEPAPAGEERQKDLPKRWACYDAELHPPPR